MDDVWIAIDTKTDRIIDFGGQDGCQLSANKHKKNSSNMTIIRKLKTGMIIKEY